MAGTYRNGKVVNLDGCHDLKILAYGDGRPVLEFDGPGGIVGGSAADPISNIEIAGVEIVGPNAAISWEEAAAARLSKPSYYTGRGVAVWGGHHLYVHDVSVHHCPGSGIRVNGGDHVTIADSEVYSNTWWSSAAESAVVLAESVSVDESDGVKMVLTNNVVYDNVNKIPYYNPNYAWDYSPIGGLPCGTFSACERGLVAGCPWQCRYGKKTQDYIIDGMGVSVTRNVDTYLRGTMELFRNTCYGNGVNGLVVHRTARAIVRQNTIYRNGVVPRLDRPEPAPQDWHAGCAGRSRQPYSGLVLSNARGVKLWSNRVAARYDDDYSFVQEADGAAPPPPVEAGGNNRSCRGRVDVDPADVVRAVSDLSVCGITPAPTGAPSSVPSAPPSGLPWSRPPSLSPSTVPSSDPSAFPSSGSSSVPSKFPSVLQSSSPSTNASASPSTNTSVPPTTNTSTRPSDLQSLNPSSDPSILPTFSPSKKTSSYRPSGVPSEKPISACRDDTKFTYNGIKCKKIKKFKHCNKWDEGSGRLVKNYCRATCKFCNEKKWCLDEKKFYLNNVKKNKNKCKKISRKKHCEATDGLGRLVKEFCRKRCKFCRK